MKQLDKAVLTFLKAAKGQEVDWLAVQTAIEEIKAELVPNITRFLKREQDVEDVLQDVFLNLVTYLRKRSDIRDPGAYVRRMASNASLRRLAVDARRAEDLLSADDLEATVHSNLAYQNAPPRPDQIAQKQDLIKVYFKAIRTLGTRTQELLTLDLRGLRPAEIAEITGLKKSVVEASLSRARKDAKKAFKRLAR